MMAYVISVLLFVSALFVAFTIGVVFGRNKEYKYWVRAFGYVERCVGCTVGIRGCSGYYEIIKEAHLVPPAPPNKR